MNRLSVLGFVISICACASASEPLPVTKFRPGQPWPDNKGVHVNAHGGGILFHEGRYWWFGEHHNDVATGRTDGVSVYSSTDLLNWRDEGMALQSATAGAPALYRKEDIIFRPKVLYNARTGKFAMWMNFRRAPHPAFPWQNAVAVADRITGPYRFLGLVRPNAGVWPMGTPESMKKPLTTEELEIIKDARLTGGDNPKYPKDLIFRRDFEKGHMAHDMTLFLDDDGKAYHIYSAEMNGTLHISQLADDFLTHSGRYKRVMVGEFNEAPVLFKTKGKYYLIASGCTSWAHNPARSYVADSIWGPYRALGNPWKGSADMIQTSYESQSTCVVPVQGKPGAFIFFADRWDTKNFMTSSHIVVPVLWREGRPVLEWMDQWDLSVFDQRLDACAGQAQVLAR